MRKFKLYYLFILLLSAPFAFAAPSKSSFSRQEKLFLSKLDEEFLEESDPEEWIVFIKQFGKDRIAVQFPTQPRLVEYDKSSEGFETYLFSAIEEDVRYSLKIETKPKGIEEVELFYTSPVEKRSPFYQLLDKSRKEGTYGSFLDLKFLDKASGDSGKKKYKKRVIANSERLYTFTVEEPAMGEDKYDLFIESFYIIKPLD